MAPYLLRDATLIDGVIDSVGQARDAPDDVTGCAMPSPDSAP